MVGEDKLERPYAYEEYEEYTWKTTLKRILKYVVMIAIIGVIGWFVYDYFIGSFLTVEISVVNLEGKGISDSSITVREAGTGTIVFEESGLSTYAVRLRRGLYTVRAEADGFKPKTTEPNFSEGYTEETIKLKKDIDVKILSLDMPIQLFANQNFDIVVTLENKGKSREEIEFKFGGEFVTYNCRPIDRKIFIEAGEIADFNVNCTVPTITGLERAVRGTTKEGSISIRYTLESMEKEFMLYPEPQISIAKSINFFGMHPTKNAKKQQEFLIQNLSRFPIYNIRLSIEISSAEKNNPEEVIKWISFTNARGEDRTSHLIEMVDSREKYREPIELSIPPDANEEKIFGSIILKAPFLEAPKKVDLVIDITKSAEALLSLEFEPSILISFSDNKPQSKIETIEVKNDGDLDIQNIDLYVQNFDECTENWLSFKTSSSIAELKAGESKEVYITASAPSLAKTGEYRACILRLSYTHPLTKEIVVEEAGVLQVKRVK